MGLVSGLGIAKVNLDVSWYELWTKNGQLHRLNNGLRLKYKAVTNIDLKIQ